MTKKIKNRGYKIVEGKRCKDNLLLPIFFDDDGEEYEWAPKWIELDILHRQSKIVERLNQFIRFKQVTLHDYTNS